MKLLLDTHAFVWFVLNDLRLSPIASGLMRDPRNQIAVSPAVYWELAVKISIGKYSLNEPFGVFMQSGIFGNGFHILPIQPEHAEAILTLPHHHRDPFDRLLVALAIVEQIPIVSADGVLDQYPVTRFW